MKLFANLIMLFILLWITCCMITLILSLIKKKIKGSFSVYCIITGYFILMTKCAILYIATAIFT